MFRPTNYGNKSGSFDRAYQLETVRPWGYLLVDLNSNSEDKYRLRTIYFRMKIRLCMYRRKTYGS